MFSTSIPFEDIALEEPRPYAEEPPSVVTSIDLALGGSSSGSSSRRGLNADVHVSNLLLSPTRRGRRATRRARPSGLLSSSSMSLSSSSVSCASSNNDNNSPPPHRRFLGVGAASSAAGAGADTRSVYGSTEDSHRPGAFSVFPSHHPSSQDQEQRHHHRPVEDEEEDWKQLVYHHEDDMTTVTDAMTTMTTTTFGSITLEGSENTGENEHHNHQEHHHEQQELLFHQQHNSSSKDNRIMDSNFIPEHLLQDHANALAQQQAEYEHYQQQQEQAAASSSPVYDHQDPQQQHQQQQQSSKNGVSEETLAFGQFAADAIQAELQVQYVLLDATEIPNADLVYSLMQYAQDPILMMDDSKNEELCHQIKLARITINKYELRQLTELSRRQQQQQQSSTNTKTRQEIPYLVATVAWDNEWEFVCQELDQTEMVEVALPLSLLYLFEIPLIQTLAERLRRQGNFPRHDDWVPGVLLVVRHLCRIHDLPMCE